MPKELTDFLFPDETPAKANRPGVPVTAQVCTTLSAKQGVLTKPLRVAVKPGPVAQWLFVSNDFPPQPYGPGVQPGPDRPPKGSPPPEYDQLGRSVYGDTAPSNAKPCERTSPLTSGEVNEVANLIAEGRSRRHAVHLPEHLRTRDWASIEKVLLALDARLGWEGAGWKVGAASEQVRNAEGLPSPSPGRIYRRTVYPSGAELPPELFINYRNCEAEFAFELGLDFPPRERPYTETDALAGIEALFPAIELGDMVFTDWYGASGYFGPSLDNGGGAAFVRGARADHWDVADLPDLVVDLYLNGSFIKSGRASAAMGNPVTSLTWLLNWVRLRGRTIRAGEVVSTGTCTGHLFASRGDTVRADFHELGIVAALFT